MEMQVNGVIRASTITSSMNWKKNQKDDSSWKKQGGFREEALLTRLKTPLSRPASFIREYEPPMLVNIRTEMISTWKSRCQKSTRCLHTRSGNSGAV